MNKYHCENCMITYAEWTKPSGVDWEKYKARLKISGIYFLIVALVLFFASIYDDNQRVAAVHQQPHHGIIAYGGFVGSILYLIILGVRYLIPVKLFVSRIECPDCGYKKNKILTGLEYLKLKNDSKLRRDNYYSSKENSEAKYKFKIFIGVFLLIVFILISSRLLFFK